MHPNEQDAGDKECFWNRKAGVATEYGAKSQFNKEKWLPMVYTPFLISHYCCSEMKKKPMHRYQSLLLTESSHNKFAQNAISSPLESVGVIKIRPMQA